MEVWDAVRNLQFKFHVAWQPPPCSWPHPDELVTLTNKTTTTTTTTTGNLRFLLTLFAVLDAEWRPGRQVNVRLIRLRTPLAVASASCTYALCRMETFFQQLLLNNRAPNPYEAHILANLRAKDVVSLDQLVAQLQSANTAHDSATQAFQATERELSYRRAECEEATQRKWALETNIQSLAQRLVSYEFVLSPLRQLPDEVLSEVFITVHASQMLDYDNAENTRIVDSPIILSQVSDQWRRVALATPRLWSFIQIIASKWPFGRPLLEHYLNNSRSTHLRLCLEDVVRETPIDDIFRFLRPHKRRVTDLQYRLEDRKEPPFDFEDYLWLEYPFNTRTFRLVDHSVHGGAFGAILSLPHYNRVTRLCLLNVALEALTYVRDRALDHLEVLEWKSSSKRCGPSVTMDDTLAIFSKATSLKRLYLENLHIELSLPTIPRIKTPHGLLLLSARNIDHDIIPTADRIDFPHLQSLSFYGDSSFDVCSTVHGFGASLTTLGLFELKYTELEPDNHIDEWSDSLAQLRKLERLEMLLDDYLFDVVMRSLIRSIKKSPSNLPNLRVFHIDARSATPGASLVELIHIRKESTAATQLERVILGSPDILEEDILRELSQLLCVEFARFDSSFYILEDGTD